MKLRDVKYLAFVHSKSFMNKPGYKSRKLSLEPTFFFFLIIYLFIYLFLAVLGLRFCARAFSSCGERGPLFIAVRRPLTITASPVAEHRLQTRRLSNCGSRAQLLRGMWEHPRPGLEPVSPALAGRFPTTAPPGKPMECTCNFCTRLSPEWSVITIQYGENKYDTVLNIRCDPDKQKYLPVLVQVTLTSQGRSYLFS